MPDVMIRRRPALSGLLFLYAFLRQVTLISSIGVNRSIDDTLGDSVTGDRPTYLPDTLGVWEDNTCLDCALVPPTSNAFDGTYTAATYNPDLKNISISFAFTGTAIYVYFILANNPDPGISASTAANFTLDGNLVSTFTHSPDSSSSAPDFYFNNSALAFSKTSLKNVTHQMVISTSGLNSNYYLNFDYALYTFQNPSTATSSTSSSSSATSSTTGASTSLQSDSKSVPTGAIAGGVVGGVAVVTIICAVWFFCLRRKKKKADEYHHDDPNTVLQSEIDPFILPPAPMSDAYTLPDNSFSPPSTFRTSTALLKRSATGTTEAVPHTSTTINLLPSDSKAAIRRQRQQELERQMQQIGDEIKDLQIEAEERNAGRDGMSTMMSPTSGQSRAPLSATRSSRPVRSPRSPYGNEDVSQLKAQIQAMSEHIAYLQDQQNSAWAQGLSDEPPPGYSPGPVDGHAVLTV
ncbi:hypothetical protein DFJ43DRAFT_1042076 [Lentinula guzmanii]|uniref:Epidermal growth factor receptor-like transmembrane-juxtamembrane segment domain-containing protein n=1 Tax=Lentinula guzmanii TaxID=2804957 RepID=A0AA38J6G2_9AGAR|nr:hypothetical protein DFJ43DRAFT_1042076 [Lentinula guzmanii]